MDELPAHLRPGGGVPGLVPGKGLLELLLTLSVVFSLLAGGYAWARKEVTISVDGQTMVVQTLQRDVGGLLAEEGIALAASDLVEPGLETPLERGMEILIKRAQPFVLKVDGETREIASARERVGEALAGAGVVLGPLDRTVPPGDTPLTPGMEIEVIRGKEEVVTIEVPVPFQVQRQSDDSLPRGQSKIIQKGREGLAERVVRYLYENGEKVLEGVIAENIIEEPVPQVVAVGTLTTLASRGGENLRFKEMLIMEATAYAPDPRCNGVNQYTATGRRARRGVVAVDPRVIPLGTRLYVEGYGNALAADTGGAIKGKKIDLCFDTYEEAIRFGRRQVKVYILE